MRNILVTNDDGIFSPGIRLLSETAAEFGRVTVLAPDRVRSGGSQSVNFHKDFLLKPYDMGLKYVSAFSFDGTPADCVRAVFNGLSDRNVNDIIPFERPDLVLSGINDEMNAGCDILYSATVGTAMEAVLYDVPAICFSAHRAKGGMGEVTKKYLKEILSELLERPLPAGQIYNVNFPSCPISAFKGILYDRVPAQIPGYHDTYHPKKNDDGSLTVTIDPVPMESAPDGTDIGAVLTGHISIGIVQNMVKR